MGCKKKSQINASKRHENNNNNFSFSPQTIISNKRFSVNRKPSEPKCKNVHSGGNSYHVIHHQALIDAIRVSHKAGGCESEIQVYHHVNISAYKLTVKCTPCKFEHDIVNPINSKGVDDITLRLVLGCLESGVSYTQWTKLCDVAEMQPLLTKDIWENRHGKIYDAVLKTWKEVQTETVTKIKSDCESKGTSEPYTHVTGSFDGTYPTRGHTSKNGIAFMMDEKSGCVIDMGHRSKICNSEMFHSKKKSSPEYKEWYEKHKEVCPGRYTGSSGSMESDICVEIFNRSHDLGLEYTQMICDGDSKSYDAVKGTYGMCHDCVLFEKKSMKDKAKYLETTEGKHYSELHASGEAKCKKVRRADCTNHSEKRLGTALRDYKKSKSTMTESETAF